MESKEIIKNLENKTLDKSSREFYQRKLHERVLYLKPLIEELKETGLNIEDISKELYEEINLIKKYDNSKFKHRTKSS